ncbi:putative Sex determination protein tasselseed-2 [Glarea lozoyensis 74030]|uniref:Putative Sex determination protein tasselseed-2 n=1 Tax=Glarea lozoyensis (strain ATCC 74030 / MF5533) TaxID=1104152 RepID=H0EZ11_GLAL7|nr:putative Sex determination protein tasselseed-2 [Glarea lozoyensis 74030]
MEGYTTSAPVDCTKELDTGSLKGKTVIVTGGANGIGEAYVRALSAEGVNVCIGDFDENRGEKIASELKNAKFVKCDVSNWQDQARMFAEAASFTGKVDFVVANAGICPEDEIFAFEGL